MKSSVGVTICAVLLLVGSALALLGAGGIAFVAAGPLSRQFFDPANLPPGADVSVMRSMMLGSALITGIFSAFGITTGIGLIRLWKWARYAAIVFGSIVIVGSVLPGIAFLFVKLPPPSGQNGQMAQGFRFVLAAFYWFWAILAGIFVYVMARKSTAAQFEGEGAAAAPRLRPISVTIIAWLMIVSGVMTIPMVLWMKLPALLFGLVLTGLAAKLFYALYMVAYAVIGAGLIKRPAEAVTPAIVLHAVALVNALTMLVPSVWAKYQAAVASISTMFGAQTPASMAGTYFGVFFGALFAIVILIFLLRARRTLAATAGQ